MTPEQVAAQKEYQARWYASRTPEQREATRQRSHADYVKRRDADPEAMRAKGRETFRRAIAKDPQRLRDYRNRQYANDPETHRAYQRAYAQSHPEQFQDKQLKRYYGITLLDYMRLFEEQGGVCAICQEPETMTLRGRVKSLSVDHDHATGYVRALLCSACNRALGYFRDNERLVQAAADYLTTHRRDHLRVVGE